MTEKESGNRRKGEFRNTRVEMEGKKKSGPEERGGGEEEKYAPLEDWRGKPQEGGRGEGEREE